MVIAILTDRVILLSHKMACCDMYNQIPVHTAITQSDMTEWRGFKRSEETRSRLDALRRMSEATRADKLRANNAPVVAIRHGKPALLTNKNVSRLVRIKALGSDSR
jgi:hypothetical protein